MEIKWLNADAEYNKLIIAGDIGGTNTNLALVGEKDSKFTIILEVVFSSPQINDLADPIKELLEIAKKKNPSLVPHQCCISSAGPVSDNVCVMTNLDWIVDGNALEKALGMKTIVINDFLAISYGIPTLDINNKDQIIQLVHADGTTPEVQASTKAVIGPGTGMGVSFLVWDGTKYIPASSEGGHITYAAFDDETKSFRDYMEKKLGHIPPLEPLVSGMGLKNIYYYFKDTKGLPKTDEHGVWAKIAATPDSDIPAQIAIGADKEELCAEMMRLFVKMLAHYSNDLSALFFPTGGFYLAGGVVMKNLKWLQEDDLFMKYFGKNDNPNIYNLLKNTPVFVIKDYAISLYGAANASISL